MKERTCFVSNSSSSSYIIYKKYISEEQINMIKNHIRVSNDLDLDIPDLKYFGDYDKWDIQEIDNERFRVSTMMDNFPMHLFLELIGVPDVAIVYEGQY